MDALAAILRANSSVDFLNMQDNEGNTALMSALICQNFEKAKMLLSTGNCDTNLVNEWGENCAHIAALRDNLEMVQMLAPTTNIFAMTITGNTIMRYALAHTINWDLVRWLLAEYPELPSNNINKKGISLLDNLSNAGDRAKYISLVAEIRGETI